MEPRIGSNQDVTKMSKLFSELGFTIIIQNDLSRRNMERQLKNFAQDRRHLDSEMMVLIIMAHGSLGKIWCTDGKEVRYLHMYLFHFLYNQLPI